jgi:hypothetical protein
MVAAALVDTQNAYLVLNHAADWMPSTSAATAHQRGPTKSVEDINARAEKLGHS